MNSFPPNDLYHDSASSRSPPRSVHPHQTQSLHRDATRPYDPYMNQQSYAMDDVHSRFEPTRYADTMNPSLRSTYAAQYDVGLPSAWNSSGGGGGGGGGGGSSGGNNYGHSNTLAALGATTRGKQGQRSVRPGLPSGWLDQPQPLPATFGSFGNPSMPYGALPQQQQQQQQHPSAMRPDHAHQQQQQQQLHQQQQHQHQQLASESDEDLIPTAIVIKNIPFAVKKEQLVAVMTDMALPLPYAFNYHFDNGVFRGLAFANFTSPEETAAVIQAMNHLDLHGRKLRVEYKKMLPQAERDRIEREKRERRGQLEEQHRPMAGAPLNTQPSMSSLGSHQHVPATSPSPNSSRAHQPGDGGGVGGGVGVDMNDPLTLNYYSKLLLFQGDTSAGDVLTFAPDLPAAHRKLIHSLAHKLGLGHISHGQGDSRQVHVYRNPNGMSPPLPQGVDAQRRQLNRAATTDFGSVRAQHQQQQQQQQQQHQHHQHQHQHQDANFYSGLGNQSAGFLGFSDTQGGLSVGSNLRAARSFADLRSYTPSPAQSASSFPAGLTGNISRFQDYGPGSPNSSRSNVTPTSANMPEGLLSGMGGMTLGAAAGAGSAFGQPTVGSPHRLRGVMSWDREGPGPIGGHRTFSAQQDDASRTRGGQAGPVRQPRGPMPERGTGFPRGRQNGHQQRGSDELSPNNVEIVVE